MFSRPPPPAKTTQTQKPPSFLHWRWAKCRCCCQRRSDRCTLRVTREGLLLSRCYKSWFDALLERQIFTYHWPWHVYKLLRDSFQSLLPNLYKHHLIIVLFTLPGNTVSSAVCVVLALLWCQVNTGDAFVCRMCEGPLQSDLETCHQQPFHSRGQTQICVPVIYCCCKNPMKSIFFLFVTSFLKESSALRELARNCCLDVTGEGKNLQGIMNNHPKIGRQSDKVYV